MKHPPPPAAHRSSAPRRRRFTGWDAFILVAVLTAGLLASCGLGRGPEAAGTATDLPAQTALATREPSSTPAPSATLVPTQTQLPTRTPRPSVTPTPDPYGPYTIEHLSERSYGGGSLAVHETLAVNGYFTRTLISYPSDGLEIYGFLNTPANSSPPRETLPVVIALHGYIEPTIYATVDYTTRYADALARAGYLVLHPNLRGYPPSDSGDDLFRTGMAIDVLNLIAIVRAEAGKPGPLERADPERIGLWGHSMGGGISTRVMVVSPYVKAVVLYGAMSGDEAKNYERINTYFSGGTRGLEELRVPPEALPRISPIYFLNRVAAAVSIHHGEADPDVPPPWSNDLCRRLRDLNKTVECFVYKGQGHTFHDEGDTLFMQRMIDFYRRTLAAP